MPTRPSHRCGRMRRSRATKRTSCRCTATPAVKVRDGLLDTKVLQRVNGAGLQLWVPTMKAGFPLDEPALAAAFAALGVPLPATTPSDHGLQAFLDELVGSRDDLRVVETHKSRRRSVLDDCMVELTDVSVEGRSIRTVAVESPDPDLRDGDGPPAGAGRSAQHLRRPGSQDVARLGTDAVRSPRRRHQLGQVHPRRPRRARRAAPHRRHCRGHPARRRPGAGRRADPGSDASHGRCRRRSGRGRPREGPLDIVAVGTAGLRQAPNRDEFVEAVHARCGVTVEVISGREEARLAYLAAVSALALTGDRLLVFDSGGGSSQFTFGKWRPDRGAVQPRRGRGALHRAVRARRRRPSRDTSTPRSRRLRPTSDPWAADHAPDMVIAIGGTCHQPGGGQARPRPLRPGGRARHGRRCDRGGSTDRGATDDALRTNGARSPVCSRRVPR